MTTANPQGHVSVGELVRRRAGDEDDPWDLALVQRAEVWDDVRMRHLLDSLLAGYPIGALLLCRVKEGSRVIHVEDGAREVVEASRGTWQLVDGQQRIFALYSLFTGRGHGRFYLRMTTRREPPGPATKKSNKARALTYIAWQQAPDPEVNIPERGERIDLARWYDWVHERPDRVQRAQEALRLDRAAVGPLLKDIDPEFDDKLGAEERATAAERFERLLDLWVERSIPVQTAEIRTPHDVLEVFTRINLAGVNVAGRDVYYAAVKTYWNDAEARLQHVADAVPDLDRMRALRVISRLGSRAIGQGDLLPLTIDRLAGPKGVALIDAMRRLTSDGSPAVERMARASRHVRANSRLGYGLHHVSRDLWDHVLAWAAVRTGLDDTVLSSNMPAIDAYLLGATLFRYPTVLGNRFSRVAMSEVLRAGSDGHQFPVDEIPSVIRGAFGVLRANRRAIPGLWDADERLSIANRRYQLLLSVVQRITYQPEDAIDWDHIYPRAQARRMWTKPAGAKRRRHHRHRHYVNSAGNLWALDASTNRALGDTPPVRKFQQIEEWATNGRRAVWPRDRWWLSERDQTDFEYVDRRLDDDPQNVDRAMSRFRTVVARRADGLIAHAMAEFPQARLFAADEEVPASELGDVPDISPALGLAHESDDRLV